MKKYLRSIPECNSDLSATMGFLFLAYIDEINQIRFSVVDVGGLTTPPPCIDKDLSCNRYQKDTCTNPQYSQWANDNCRAYCGLCSKYE